MLERPSWTRRAKATPMQYQVEIDVDLPRGRVIELFDDPDNLPKWQRGFVSFAPISGTPGQPGARSKLVHQLGKRWIEMVETITVRDLPERFDGTYDAPGVHNVVRNRFLELDSDRTRWVSENEFRFRGFMRLVGLVFRGAFPRQSLQYMQDFKAFAETGKDVRKA
jgi:hypothetical protein